VSDDSERVQISSKQVSLPWAAVLAALSVALGGGAGSWAGSAQVETEVRDLDKNQAVLKRDVDAIKENVRELRDASKDQGEAIVKLDKKVDRVLILLEERAS